MKSLEKIILNEVRKVINEEMGISFDVNNEVYNIIDEINKNISNKEDYLQFSDALCVLMKEFKTMIFEGLTIDVKVKVFVCKTEESYDYAKKMERYYYNPAKKCINFSFPAWRPKFECGRDVVRIGRPGTYIASVIAHELKHAYQDYKTNIDIPDEKFNLDSTDGSMNYKEAKLYYISNQLLKNPNKQVSVVGYYLYYVNDNEITANVQGLYTQLLQDSLDYKESMKNLKYTKYYRDLKMLKYTLDCIKDGIIGPRIMGFIEKKYNRPKEWIIKTLEIGYKKLLKGLGRVKVQVKKHFDMEEEMFGPIDYNMDF